MLSQPVRKLLLLPGLPALALSAVPLVVIIMCIRRSAEKIDGL